MHRRSSTGRREPATRSSPRPGARPATCSRCGTATGGRGRTSSSATRAWATRSRPSLGVRLAAARRRGLRPHRRRHVPDEPDRARDRGPGGPQGHRRADRRTTGYQCIRRPAAGARSGESFGNEFRVATPARTGSTASTRDRLRRNAESFGARAWHVETDGGAPQRTRGGPRRDAAVRDRGRHRAARFGPGVGGLVGRRAGGGRRDDARPRGCAKRTSRAAASRSGTTARDGRRPRKRTGLLGRVVPRRSPSRRPGSASSTRSPRPATAGPSSARTGTCPPTLPASAASSSARGLGVSRRRSPCSTSRTPAAGSASGSAGTASWRRSAAGT